MFCLENASESECQEFLNWVSENYSSDDPDKKEAIELLSNYYVTRDLPLCGMKSWFKRDYERFCRGNKNVVERLKPKPKQDFVSTNSSFSRSGDPSWRGPNGTWSLD